MAARAALEPRARGIYPCPRACSTGIVVPMEAHNPTIARANDGTCLLFSIGNTPLVQSRSLNGQCDDGTGCFSVGCGGTPGLAPQVFFSCETRKKGVVALRCPRA